MHFQQFAPPAYLKEYVRYFWLLEGTGSVAEPTTFRMVADGYPGLILQQTPSLFRDQSLKQWPRMLLYGQTTSPGDICVAGPFRTLGVYFHPQALTTIFGLGADELTNSCVDFDLLAASVAEQLLNMPTVAAQIRCLSEHWWALLCRNRKAENAAVEYALQQLRGSGGGVSLLHLQQRLGLSERTFQRRFRQQVGIAPKLFARICQFQVSLDQLRRQQYHKLSDVAFENNYADQSHHIRAFQEFAGFTPQQYQKKVNEVVENFPVLLE